MTGRANSMYTGPEANGTKDMIANCYKDHAVPDASGSSTTTAISTQFEIADVSAAANGIRKAVNFLVEYKDPCKQ